YWAETDYPPPNHHLIVDYLSSDYVDGYRYASPFERIGDVFYEKNYVDIRQNILDLYPLCCTKKTLKIEVTDLRYTLRLLLETGWLLLQTDYFPEDWLDPDCFDVLFCPVPEAKLEYYWKPKGLFNKEQKNLRKTLSKLYCDVDVRHEIYSVEGRIILHYSSSSLDMSEKNLETRNRLLKTLDVLTLIVLDLRKRRTKLGGVRYPPKPKEVTVPNIEDTNPSNDN